MLNLTELQHEVEEWHDKTFGDSPSWSYLLGLQEELGELSHSYLKRFQNIRVDEDHNLAIKDAIGDIVIFLLGFCNSEGLFLEDELMTTWTKVRARDIQDFKERNKLS